jgi:glycosyltransferase involved in cell wall biosynthesis
MRIAMVSSGRFWLCDLARELDAHGHDVRLYSLVPPWRTRAFGLPDRCNRWLGPYLAPVYAMRRLAARTRVAESANHLLSVAIDQVVARLVAPCDVLIGLSQLSLACIDGVRRRFGARAFLERGSRHIVSQREILAGIAAAGAAGRVPDWAVRRELAEYERADMIVVPSTHARTSFVERGMSASKLFRNPYGVDLTMFPATPAPPPDLPPTIIMVGTWSLRKGCDVLVDAWQRLTTPGTRLVHVGQVGDAPLPATPGFTHHDAVDQRRLTQWYAQAHVLALASREEGLALVQAQALASGLHIAASDRTGADDLQACLEDPRAVAIAPVGDAVAFADALDTQLAAARAMRGTRDLLRSARHGLTWEAYGSRYDAMLRGRRP